MVNYKLILGTETTVHGQLHTYSGDRGCCSWSITHLFWAQRPLFMVNYTLILGTEAAVHGQLHTKSGHRDCCSCSFTHLILGQFSCLKHGLLGIVHRYIIIEQVNRLHLGGKLPGRLTTVALQYISGKNQMGHTNPSQDFHFPDFFWLEIFLMSFLACVHTLIPLRIKK